MASILDPVFDTFDSFLAWLGASLKQTTESYGEIEAADSETVFVAHDGA